MFFFAVLVLLRNTKSGNVYYFEGIERALTAVVKSLLLTKGTLACLPSTGNQKRGRGTQINLALMKFRVWSQPQVSTTRSWHITYLVLFRHIYSVRYKPYKNTALQFVFFFAKNSCVLVTVTEDAFCLCVKDQSCAQYEASVITEYILAPSFAAKFT